MVKAVIISCPSCQKQYTVTDDVLAGKVSQKVRCVDCLHIWTLSLLTPEESSLLHSTPHQPESGESHHIRVPFVKVPHEEEKKTAVHRYKLDWILLLGGAGLLGFFVYEERDYLIRQLPPKSVIFHREASISTPNGAPLIIQSIKYTFANGDNARRVTVTGEIMNTTNEIQNIPPLVVSVTKKRDGQLVGSAAPSASDSTWTYPLPADKILPGEKIRFETTSEESVDAIENVVVRFG
jgi:predicted Zn finger-like uncharacterized protein